MDRPEWYTCVIVWNRLEWLGLLDQIDSLDQSGPTGPDRQLRPTGPDRQNTHWTGGQIINIMEWNRLTLVTVTDWTE